MRDIILQPKNRFTWALLAFQGGYVNVGGLLSIHLFVSHITGFSAHFGTEILNGHYLIALSFLLVPLFFLFGAFFSSLFTEIRKKRHQEPVYIHILGVLSLIFLIITIFGSKKYFGNFGEPFANFRDFILLSLLTFSCGAQNAIFTHYSNSIIRTTHLTGITTDLGIGLAKYFISKDTDEQRINKIRIDIIFSFVLGSLFGAYIFPKIQFLGFVVPVILSLIVGIRLFVTRTHSAHSENDRQKSS